MCLLKPLKLRHNSSLKTLPVPCASVNDSSDNFTRFHNIHRPDIVEQMTGLRIQLARIECWRDDTSQSSTISFYGFRPDLAAGEEESWFSKSLLVGTEIFSCVRGDLLLTNSGVDLITQLTRKIEEIGSRFSTKACDGVNHVCAQTVHLDNEFVGDSWKLPGFVFVLLCLGDDCFQSGTVQFDRF